MLDYAYENYLDENKYKMRFLKTSTILQMLNLSDGEYGIHDNSETRKKLEEERAIRREQKKNFMSNTKGTIHKNAIYDI